LKTILGDCWENSIPTSFWAKGPKGCQGLFALGLALLVKGATSFNTIYLVPVGSLFQLAGWAILYFRIGYKWEKSSRTFAVILSQLCNVIGYSLQYVFVCPLVFNLTYLPYAPMSIGISIMCGQGAQWIFQTLVLGPAESSLKKEIAEAKANDLERKFGWIQRVVNGVKQPKEPYPEDYDRIMVWLMSSCIVAFLLSMTYIFVIKKCYSTDDEPIEEIQNDDEENQLE